MTNILKRSRMKGGKEMKDKNETLKAMAIKLLKQGRSLEQVGYLTALPYDVLKIMKQKIVDGLL